jgi:hypothetical protein
MGFGRAAIGGAALLLIGAAEPARDELVVTGDGVVAASVNGAPGRMRIDPAVPSLAMLGPHWAASARLRASFFGFGYLVGPNEVAGASAVARIAVGDGADPRRRRVGWTARPYAANADGVIGPGGLPQRVIRFVLRPPLPGERTVSLPLVDEGGLFGGWGGMYARIEVGGAPMRIRFDPYHPRTLATAGAAVRLASAHDGTIGGDIQSEEIAFGIERPVRILRLGRPLAIGPLALSTLGVRTADFGSTASIREEGSDPDEILVTGRRRRDTDRDRVAVGADSLARCSSILFDKEARLVSLTCA